MPQVVENVRRPGRVCKGGPKILHRNIQPVLQRIHDAERILRFDVMWIYGQGCLVRGTSFVELLSLLTVLSELVIAVSTFAGTPGIHKRFHTIKRQCARYG